jgi:hypothetical protein
VIRAPGDRALLDDPTAESCQRAGGGEGQAQEPEEHRADDRERSDPGLSQVLAGSLHAGQRPGADYAD